MFRKHINIIIVIALLMNLSCTKYVRIPESEYSGIDGSEELPARIIKTDGTTYVVRRFEIINDSVIIHQFENNHGDHDTDRKPDPSPIITVPLCDIAAIESIEMNGRNAAITAGALTLLAVGGLIAGMIIGSGMPVLD